MECNIAVKKQYKLLLSIFIIQIFVVSVLGEKGIKVQSWIGNVIGAFILLLPIQILLFLLGRDESFTHRKRLCFKVVFWFITICYLLGGFATLIE